MKYIVLYGQAAFIHGRPPLPETSGLPRLGPVAYIGIIVSILDVYRNYTSKTLTDTIYIHTLIN